jgi:1-phosphofructokinase
LAPPGSDRDSIGGIARPGESQTEPAAAGHDDGLARHRRVAVLAPAPVLTVALGPGSEVHFHAGSQGFWVARMVARLGMPATLCGPLGGESGRVLQALVPAEGVELLSVPVAQANGVSVSDLRSGERLMLHLTPSPPLERHEVDDLYGLTLAAGLSAGVVVLTGTPAPGVVPEEIYMRLAHDLRLNGARVVADLSRAELASALSGGLDLLKLSHEELISDGYAADASTAAILEGMRRLRAAGADNVLVSRAEEPALAVVGERWVEVTVPRFAPLDHHGAGDATTASLAVALAQGRGVEHALRMAAAAGALNVTRRGLGTGDRRAIDRLATRVEVRNIEPEPQPPAAPD